MNKILCTALTLIGAFAALPACASDDFYVGASIGTRGNMDFSTSAGALNANNKPRPFNVYGGFNFTEQVAIEAGYTSYGDFKYDGGREIGLSAFHLAAKGSMRINESWSAFGKAGVVRHAIDVKGAAMPVREQDKITPLFGIGVSYKLTPALMLDLQLVSHGRIKTDTGRLAYRQLQLGANFSF